MRPVAALSLAIVLSARTLILQADVPSGGIRCQPPPQSVETPAPKPPRCSPVGVIPVDFTRFADAAAGRGVRRGWVA
jgi:hypothetical protein